jgi:hypothetical protein
MPAAQVERCKRVRFPPASSSRFLYSFFDNSTDKSTFSSIYPAPLINQIIGSNFIPFTLASFHPKYKRSSYPK